MIINGSYKKKKRLAAVTSTVKGYAPLATEPKTTCLPSSHVVLDVQMKNWEPLVLGPALAMDRIPGPVCFRVKFSSANFSP